MGKIIEEGCEKTEQGEGQTQRKESEKVIEGRPRVKTRGKIRREREKNRTPGKLGEQR